MSVKPGTLLYRPTQNAWKRIDHGSPLGLQSQYKPTGVMIDWSLATLLSFSAASSCPPSMPGLPSPCSLCGLVQTYSNWIKILQAWLTMYTWLDCILDQIHTTVSPVWVHTLYLRLYKRIWWIQHALKNSRGIFFPRWLHLFFLLTTSNHLLYYLLIDWSYCQPPLSSLLHKFPSSRSIILIYREHDWKTN